jgi:hypothetical protein
VYGSGRKSTPLTMLNIAVQAPKPNASVATAATRRSHGGSEMLEEGHESSWLVSWRLFDHRLDQAALRRTDRTSVP